MRCHFFRVATTTMTLILIEGCSYTHTYPICFYDTNLGAVASAAKEWPKLKISFQEVLNGAVGSNGSAVVVTSRAAIVTAPNSVHDEIANVWPDIACYGESGGSTSTELLRTCENYISRSILASRQKAAIPPDIVIPICQTFPGEHPP